MVKAPEAHVQAPSMLMISFKREHDFHFFFVFFDRFLNHSNPTNRPNLVLAIISLPFSFFFPSPFPEKDAQISNSRT